MGEKPLKTKCLCQQKPITTTVNENPATVDYGMASAGQDKPRTVIFPIDGSEHCERAFQWYVDNAKRPNDNVKFISVIEPVYTSPAFGMAMETPPLPDVHRVMEETIQEGKKICQDKMKKAKSLSLESQAFLHVDSRPGPAIVKAVQEHGGNLVVMGNRGIGVVRRTFLGSVSDYVLHHARVPVVIVPPPGETAK
ncbi:hypothetical protein CRM22_000849 [Opisthorchis felineus]|uniref:UspA domain-containing protein n=1 Tax=Opisthorchis felineus TaxID=147828 RepID=A0A4S2MD89_OPIFE|nr:hypothetical protein CRM22_000849 [Opisthorchis felineus]